MERKPTPDPLNSLDPQTYDLVIEFARRRAAEPEWHKKLRKPFARLTMLYLSLGGMPAPVWFWDELNSFQKFTRSPESTLMLFVGTAGIIVGLAPFSSQPDVPVLDAFRLALVICTSAIGYFGMWKRQYISGKLLRYITPYIAASTFSVALFSDFLDLPLLLLLIITCLGTILFALYHIFDAIFYRPEPNPVRPQGRWL